MFKRLTMTMALAIALLIPTARLMAQAAGAEAHTAETQTHVDAAAAAHNTEAHAEHGGHAELPLLPDPADKGTWLEALWTIIIFLALLAILYPTAWKNVLAGLKKREERIRSDIAEAEAARAKAEATLKDYTAKLATAEDNIRQMLATATADGEKLATSIRMKAQAEAEDIKERANKDIEATRDAALREIYEKTADLATSVAEKIIRRNLNASDQQDLVRQSLEQLQTVK